MKEYHESLIVDKFASNIAVDENFKREDFFQIGIRHLLDNDIFDPKSNVVPYITGLARSVALGEEKYFVEKLLGIDEIEQIHCVEDEITPQMIFSEIGEWEACIITSVDIYFNRWLRKKSGIHILDIQK